MNVLSSDTVLEHNLNILNIQSKQIPKRILCSDDSNKYHGIDKILRNMFANILCIFVLLTYAILNVNTYYVFVYQNCI